MNSGQAFVLLGSGIGFVLLVMLINWLQKQHWNTSFHYPVFGWKNLTIGGIGAWFLLGTCCRSHSGSLTEGGMVMAFIAGCCILFLLWKNIKNTSKFVGVVLVPLQLVAGFFSILLVLGLLGKIDEWFFRRR